MTGFSMVAAMRISIVLAQCLASSAFVFQHAPPQQTTLYSAIAPGDRVLVVGGTGGVGQLVTKKLQANGGCKVSVTSRSRERGEEAIDDETVEVVEIDLIEESQSKIEAMLDGVSGMVVSVGTTAFPTAKWKGGNTPENVDKIAVTKLANAAAKCPTMKKVVLVTSVGVDRTDQMPFLFLNLFGVLDFKRSGEEAIKAAAASSDFDYVIVRPGRLVGGPFTNLDVARLLQIEGGAENGVECAPGDDLLGDCKRDACAEAIVQALQVEEEEAKDIDFSIISTDSAALKPEGWKAEF
eukprot:CAMPEP_0168774110 /NCGR_PEP_ID=MMETSP0725-20121227/4825_1 /TAXON_ID=265536 /ORGANISM="Amphiprora sp., Strain CCMP467" /LENGTH=294 /DNA_ID=CAMNT_0008823693 /DNA_START=12 /DNA_END=894 /DNA_ORIENTATION=+